jgi:hypothetical protein
VTKKKRDITFKTGNGSQILSVINNLAKKQQNLEAASGNGSPKEVKVPSVIHGQTTITKRVIENGGNGSAPAGANPTNLPTSHSIPSGTTITIKQAATASATTTASPKTSSVVTQSIKCQYYQTFFLRQIS